MEEQRLMRNSGTTKKYLDDDSMNQQELLSSKFLKFIMSTSSFTFSNTLGESPFLTKKRNDGGSWLQQNMLRRLLLYHPCLHPHYPFFYHLLLIRRRHHRLQIYFPIMNLVRDVMSFSLSSSSSSESPNKKYKQIHLHFFIFLYLH